LLKLFGRALGRKRYLLAVVVFWEHFLLLRVWRGSEEVVVRRSLSVERKCVVVCERRKSCRRNLGKLHLFFLVTCKL
jgi:hypothetical protein